MISFFPEFHIIRTHICKPLFTKDLLFMLQHVDAVDSVDLDSTVLSSL